MCAQGQPWGCSEAESGARAGRQQVLHAGLCWDRQVLNRMTVQTALADLLECHPLALTSGDAGAHQAPTF